MGGIHCPVVYISSKASAKRVYFEHTRLHPRLRNVTVPHHTSLQIVYLNFKIFISYVFVNFLSCEIHGNQLESRKCFWTEIGPRSAAIPTAFPAASSSAPLVMPRCAQHTPPPRSQTPPPHSTLPISSVTAAAAFSGWI